MRLTEAHAALLRLGVPCFTTNDASTLLGVTGSHANKILERLSKDEHVVRLARGRWGLPGKLEPFALPEALVAPTPAYVSLLSALHHHEMIEQIPASVYAVTLGPTRRYTTPLGDVSLHRVAPGFFFGFEQRGTGPKIAVPEKALVDTLYMQPSRSRLFRTLPELEIPRRFRAKEARRMAGRIASPSRRHFVLSRLDEVLAM